MLVLTPSLGSTAQGDQVKTLQTNLTKVGFTIPSTETGQGAFGAGTTAAVKQFQAQAGLPVTGLIDAVTQAMLNNAAALAGTNQAQVTGLLFMDYGLPASGVTLRLYLIGFGRTASKLSETKSDANGVYSLAYAPPPAPSTNLEVRALDPQGKEVTISGVIYNITQTVVLNLVAPASVQPLTAEYQRMSADLQKAVGGIQNLGTAQESDTQQDLTLLNQSTGWDARLLGLAAIAAQQTAATGLGQDVLYALFRTGLPNDLQKLALVPAATIGTALTKATQAGIINLTAAQITAAQTAFTAYAAKTNLNIKIPGAPSSFSDLLANILTTPAQQAAFAGIYFDPTISNTELWQKAAAAGISAANIAALKVQGQLARLTHHSAEVVKALQQQLGPTADPAALADKDFYLDTTWINLLNSLAGTDQQKLQSMIPSIYEGAAPTDQLKAYATDLARRIRLTYHTRVIARMVETNHLPLPGPGTLPAKVATFLRSANSAGYQLGRTPLNSFLHNLSQSITAPDAATVSSVKTLHRLYQITPSDGSLQSLLKAGFTSARDITAYTKEEFRSLVAGSIPSLEEADLVYRKAQQIRAVTFNVFAAAKHLDTTPPIFALSSTQKDLQSAKNAIVQRFAGMASLFGSLDFCECDHCRSVLSPAAYLVDILHFLDPDQWDKIKTNWQSRHGGEAYPNDTPFAVLTKRRPDLPNLNLSCENTETALPYIDLVNEILEFYLASNGALTPQAVYDTGWANSADLVAEPQNILPAAYSILANRTTAMPPAVYPLELPFDLWIETVRGFLNYFKIPLGQVLDVCRPADRLELLTDTNNYPYYRASIFVENLGLSPAEYALYTLPTNLANWFGLYGYTNQATALAELASAKTLADTLDISYQDLANIIETGFLNPSLVPLTIPLRKFGLSLNDVFAYTSQPGYILNPPITAAQKAAFEQKLQALTKRYYPVSNPTALQNWLNAVLTAGYSSRVLILQAPAQDPSDFRNTKFQYAGGNAATPSDFLKLNLFVRLWKKLGWSISELDRALQAFLMPLFPPPADPNAGADLAKGMATALIYLSHLQTLFEKLGTNDRAGLLPIWGNIPTTGDNPLYAQTFLTAAVLNNDSVFDDPAGQYLCYFDTTQGKYLPFRWKPGQQADDVANGYVLLGNHLTALQGALGLTASDIESILAENGLDINTAPLTLANVSLLYRYALLSQGLQLSIKQFVALKQMGIDMVSGNVIDPFAPLKSTPLAVLADDAPWAQTLRFTEQVAIVLSSGFAVEDLQYLLHHQVADPAGKYRQDPNVLMQEVRALATIIHSIQSQTAQPADPTAFTDDLIRQKISQVFSPDVAQTFMAMWTGTIRYTAARAGVSSAIPSTLLADRQNIQLAYDPTTSTQTLVFQGVPVAKVVSDITNELATLVTNSAITAAQQTVLQGLLSDVQAQALTFFQAHLQQTAGGPPQAGFLQAADFDTLFAPPLGSATARAKLAAAFLPHLQGQLITQSIVQALRAKLGTTASLTKTLLTDTTILSDPTQPAGSPAPLLAAFQAADDIGVTVTYYSDGAESAPVGSGTVATANTDKSTNPNRPATVNSARFEGYMEFPADGPYKFTISLPNNTASAILQFDFLTQPLIAGSGATGPVSNFAQFKAGIPCHFTLDYLNLGGGDAAIQIQGETIPQGPLSQLVLYPAASVARYNRAEILLAKTFQLIAGFGLDETEVVYIVNHPTDFGGVNFKALPTQASDDSPSKARSLFGQFLRLANYSDLRKGVAGNTDGLVSIFQNTRQIIPPTVSQPAQQATRNFCQLIANLTRRDPGTIQAAITQLWGPNVFKTSTVGTGAQAQVQFTVAPLVNDIGFRRLWEALQMLQTLAVKPRALGQLTGIVYPSRAASSDKPDPGATIVAALRNAIKTRYTPDLWRPIAQSVFDPLRQAKRDALCAYILNLPAIQSFGVTDRNGLFEYFLVDPGMEPVVQTSRIRLAISSVQTFIQRCFLNLEKEVEPSIIDSNRWDWMTRYRVWEANRKIFLWPENWLIPEFRENSTDLFQALQSALLQGDITQDLVEQAFTQYLQDLDTRARLDIVSLFNQPPSPSDPPGANILHVIGRNHSKPQKHFYRTFANGIWSGWIPITVDLEGDHIVAVIWRGRLNIFWLTFVPQAQQAQQSGSPSPGSPHLTDLTFKDFSDLVAESRPQKKVRIQLNRTEYYQGKWAARASSDLTRFSPIPVGDDFDPATDVFVRVSIDSDDNGDEVSVRIHLDANNFFPPGGPRSFRLTGKNSEPDFGDYWQPTLNQSVAVPPNISRIGDTRNFTPYFVLGCDATKYLGSSPVFQASFPQGISVTDAGQVQIGNRIQEPILNSVNSFDLLSCNNPVVLALTRIMPPVPGASPGLIDKVYTALISMLSSPFFYLDTANTNSNEELTFFVQPHLTEIPVSQPVRWAIPPAFPDSSILDPTYWSSLVLTSQAPIRSQPIAPDPNSIFQYKSTADWLTDDSAALAFNTSVIGRVGRIDPGKIVSVGVNGNGLKVISSSALDFAGATFARLKTKPGTMLTN
jgi:peptidoglycan hydrolase-like protein with peptidoglycan-binding domain